jgi:F420-non-reducing hydrogenase small subunit
MKPKVAFYWCASCGGCEEAVLDLAEDLLGVLEQIEVVFWPVALDFKVADVEAMPDQSIDISFVNGAIRTTEQAHMARLMRRKSKTLVAFGACAQLGGIPGLANLSDSAELLSEAYGSEVPVLDYRENGYRLTLPKLLDVVLPLDRLVPVEYTIPGCPPSPKVVADGIGTLLGGDLPEPGTVLAPKHAMCDECPRRDTHPGDLAIERFARVIERPLDPDRCLMAQGLACLGPATRAGCGARCISGNMPCTGCFGPTKYVRDFGAKALCSIASIAAANDDQEIERAFNNIVDPVGTFYRYSFAAGFLQRKRME